MKNIAVNRLAKRAQELKIEGFYSIVMVPVPNPSRYYLIIKTNENIMGGRWAIGMNEAEAMDSLEIEAINQQLKEGGY